MTTVKCLFKKLLFTLKMPLQQTAAKVIQVEFTFKKTFFLKKKSKEKKKSLQKTPNKDETSKPSNHSGPKQKFRLKSTTQ